MTRSFAVFAAALLLCGCPDGGKVSEEKAAQVASRLVPVVKADADQVRRGLPEGAKKLATLLDSDPGANPSGLQRSIGQARASTKDLDTAKSTFFSFADTTGVVIRSEADPDTLAQHSILVPLPALKKALCEAAGKDRHWLNKVRPYFGHFYHFHVRIGCPSGSTNCQAQPPVPDVGGAKRVDIHLCSDRDQHLCRERLEGPEARAVERCVGVEDGAE
jgi:hypothetical protein